MAATSGAGGMTGGVSGGVTSAGASTGGVTLSEAPPFSLPVTSLPAFAPCDSFGYPEPLGFLADGRPVVVQRGNGDLAPAGDLVRAWDPSTRELETLVVTEPGSGLLLSGSGRRLFELSPLGAIKRAYRTHDLQPGAVTSSELISAPVLDVSSDGNFVLDERLRRLTGQGEPDFDFAPLLSELTRAQARYAALSFAGDAIAVPWREVDAETWHVELVDEDGRALDLTEAPVLGNCCNALERFACGCGVSFSHDGRYLLGFANDRLRVWDTATAEVVLRVDGPQVRRASFVHGTDRVLVASDSGAMEHSIDGSAPLPTSINRPTFATGPDATLGYLDDTLVVAKREQVLQRWPQLGPNWSSAVAVTENAAFAIVEDEDFDPLFGLMLARYERNVAGPTALLRPQESQSEWVGQLSLSPDQQRVAVVFPDSVRILDAKTLEPLSSLPTGAGAIAWSPDGRYLVTSPDLHYRDIGRPAYVLRKTLDFWDAASGQRAASYATPVHTQEFAFSADGAKIVAWGQEVKVTPPEDESPGAVTTFDRTGEGRSFTLDVVTGGIAESALGRIIGSTREVVATERGLFRVSTGEPVSLFVSADSATEPPSQVVLAPDASVGVILGGPLSRGQVFAVADTGRTAQVPFEGRPTNLALSPGGRRLAIGAAIYCAAPGP